MNYLALDTRVMFNRSSYVTVLICAMFGTIASAATIVSVDSPDRDFPTGLPADIHEALSVSWTQTYGYTNVNISAAITQGVASYINPVYAYLTNSVGPGTTEGNEIATTLVYPSTRADPTVQLFSGLTLGPGTYYLTLWSPLRGGVGWLFSSNPPTPTLEDEATLGESRYSNGYFATDNYDVSEARALGIYIPSAPFVTWTSNRSFLFSVTGAEGLAAAPEPSTYGLIGLSLAGAAVLRKRLA